MDTKTTIATGKLNTKKVIKVSSVKPVDSAKSVKVSTEEKTLVGKKQYAINANISEAQKEMLYLVKYNSAIKRLTSLGIIKSLIALGAASETDSLYISFTKWDKFEIVQNGLKREYLYTEPVFLNALINSFEQFAAIGSEKIGRFLKEEEIPVEALKNINKQ